MHDPVQCNENPQDVVGLELVEIARNPGHGDRAVIVFHIQPQSLIAALSPGIGGGIVLESL